MPKLFKRSPIMIFILLLALIGSIGANFYLFKQAKTFYTREAEVRLNPIDHHYAKDNAAILQQPKTKPRLIIFGESRCQMWGPHHPTNWGDIEILNRGIGGESTEQIKMRLEDDVLALSPDIVILQMGDNDIKAIALLEKRTKQIVNTAERNIRYIANTLADRGVQVIITTIFPTNSINLQRRTLWSDEVNRKIDEVNARLLAWKRENVTIVDCDAFLRDGKFIKSEFALDMLHLTPAAYQALNVNLEPVVKAALAKR